MGQCGLTGHRCRPQSGQSTAIDVSAAVVVTARWLETRPSIRVSAAVGDYDTSLADGFDVRPVRPLAPDEPLLVGRVLPPRRYAIASAQSIWPSKPSEFAMVAVAIPEVCVSGVIAVSPRQQSA